MTILSEKLKRVVGRGRFRVRWWRWFLGEPPLINDADPNWNGPDGNYRIVAARHDANEPVPKPPLLKPKDKK